MPVKVNRTFAPNFLFFSINKKLKYIIDSEYGEVCMEEGDVLGYLVLMSEPVIDPEHPVDAFGSVRTLSIIENSEIEIRAYFLE